MTNTEYLEAFATKHNLKLKTKGEVGFGRPCVGFTDANGRGYIDHSPLNMQTFNEVWPQDDRLYSPPGVEAYHKHQCLAVIVEDDNFDAGLDQLAEWMRHLESQGDVEVVEYATGAVGVQAMVSGTHGKAIRFKA